MARLEKLPPYLFSAIDAARDRAIAQGVDVVDLGVGDPDRPTPEALVEVAAAAVRNPAYHRYPSGKGDAQLRRAVAGFLRRRHGVDVDPDTEVLVLLGSKEGIAHLPLSLVQEGDNVLVPDIGYPVYTQSAILAGAEPRLFNLSIDRGFLPDPGQLADLADEHTRLCWINYPNNPTGAEAGAGVYQPLGKLARERGFVLANDAAYLEVSLDAHRPVSLLEALDHRQERIIEFHSLSKMFNMTGWRLGFAVGNADVIKGLARVKESIDSGAFTAVQQVATFALGRVADDLLAQVMACYPERRRLIVDALVGAGFEVFPTQATFYVWARVPAGETSLDFCARVLREQGVVVTPGRGLRARRRGLVPHQPDGLRRAPRRGRGAPGGPLMDRITLLGIDVYAHHGVHPAERELGQRFVVDVELYGDWSEAARTDHLGDALDYVAVHRQIREVCAGTSFQLLEALAAAICTALLSEQPVERVVVTVQKPNPPIPNFLGRVAVTLDRDRPWLAHGAAGP